MTAFSVHSQLLILCLAFLDVLCGQVRLTPNRIHWTAEIGAKYAVTCTGDDKNKLEWFRQGPGPEDISRLGLMSMQMPDGPALIMHVTKSSAGEYCCTDNIDTRETRSCFNLTIQEKISFKDTPEEQNATLGDKEATIRCEAVGTPEPTISWGERISERYTVVADGLVIPNPDLQDAGYFSCFAEQKDLGELIVRRIHFQVKHAPLEEELYTNDSVTYAFENTNITLECRVSTFPKADITWLLDSAVIANETETLVVQQAGNYTCQAQNELGSISRNVLVKTGTVPGKPGTIAVRGENATAATIDFEPPAPVKGFSVTGYKLELTNKKTGKVQLLMLVTSKGPPLEVFGLEPATEYKIRIQAINQLGVGPFGTSTTAKTSLAVSLSASTSLLTLVLLLFQFLI